MANLKKEKHNEKLIFILIVIFIFILNIYLFIGLSDIVEIRGLDASIIVSDRIGFDLNSTALTFGATFRGGSSTRGIIIENNFGFPIEAEIYGKGDITRFIRPFEEHIEKDEKKSIKITAFVPEDAVFGEYKGKIIIKLKKSA